MNLQTFINIFGEVAVGLQHAMVEAAHARFLSFFEDPDDDDVYELKTRLVKLSEELGVSFSEVSGRLLDSMIGHEAEFEIDTPIHFTDNAKSADDIEVTLKSPGFLKTLSHLKMRIKFKHAPPPEGWKKIQDQVDTILQRQLKS